MENTIKPYICTVCGEKYTDTWTHALKPSKVLKGLLAPVDKIHQDRMRELEDGVEPKVGRCFCGGTVTTIGIGAEGWETACRDCEMLYDED